MYKIIGLDYESGLRRKFKLYDKTYNLLYSTIKHIIMSPRFLYTWVKSLIFLSLILAFYRWSSLHHYYLTQYKSPYILLVLPIWRLSYLLIFPKDVLISIPLPLLKAFLLSFYHNLNLIISPWYFICCSSNLLCHCIRHVDVPIQFSSCLYAIFSLNSLSFSF